MRRALFGIIDFLKTATKQSQRDKSDAGDVLYCFYSAPKKLRIFCFKRLGGDLFTETAVYFCLQSIEHVHPKHACPIGR